MRLKTKAKNFEDRTGEIDYISRMPSSQSGLTHLELDQMDAGWSDRDLYFVRAALADQELVPNRTATYFSGYDKQARQEAQKERLRREFEMLMRSRYKAKR
jgi:hypothetical protein